ncbi:MULTISPECIES: tautomerase family protein [Nocardia]|uniref:Tautomerase family protein n=1 Tax=Nocardia elegans TaxID=300029 RepID=A0ABW6TEV0_9NOCA|nr:MULTISPECIES: tautomerase family protein [Nocardia]
MGRRAGQRVLPGAGVVPCRGRGRQRIRRKAGLVTDVTEQVLAAAGLADGDAWRVWVLIHEQPEGTWGAGGSVVKFKELAALAQGQRDNA